MLLTSAGAVISLAAVALLAVSMTMLLAAEARAQASTRWVSVPASVRWFDTGIDLPANQPYAILAAGVVHLTQSGRDQGTPEGQGGCSASSAFPYPGRPCYALIGRIGPGGQPMIHLGEVDRAPSSPGGRLYLTVNDDHIADNSGSWKVAVTIGSQELDPTTLGTRLANHDFGYPYPNAPFCTSNKTTSNCAPDAWNFFEGQCTSWVAHRLRQAGIPFRNSAGHNEPAYGPSRWGHAWEWKGNAPPGAFTSTPTVGYVAWWGQHPNTTPGGHVAYVEAIRGDGTIIVSEMNAYNDNNFAFTRVPAKPGIQPGITSGGPGGRGGPDGYINMAAVKPSTSPGTQPGTQPGTTTSAPRAPKINQPAVYNATTIRLSWTPGSNNYTGFEVYEQTSRSSLRTMATWLDWQERTPGVRRCFAVRAYNAVASSPWSVTVCTQTSQARPTGTSQPRPTGPRSACQAARADAAFYRQRLASARRALRATRTPRGRARARARVRQYERRYNSARRRVSNNC